MEYAVTQVFEWRNITISAENTAIISGFSLRIEAGEKVVLFGPSGTGKTSILRSALGFMPVTEGGLYFHGEEISKKLVWGMRRKIAYIPQNPDIGEGPVQKLIDSVFELKANERKPGKDEIEELFTTFELPGALLEKDFELLSGGEKQRVGIVIAILLKRDIFFLDEITASLDDAMKEKVIRYFINRPDDTAQVIVSHDGGWKKQGGVRTVDISPYSVADRAEKT
jgi:putative ABC transport system ATP-binding protein